MWIVSRRRRICNLVFPFALVAMMSGSLDSIAEAQGEPVDTEPVPLAREDTYETARGLGMGMGTRASVIGTSALAYNAANLPLARLYHIEATALTVPGEGAWSVGGAITDSVTSWLAAGVGFRGVFGEGSRDHSGWDGRIALGFPLADVISLGVSGRYVRLNAAQDEMGRNLSDEVDGFTVDASARLTPLPGLHIAALAYNLVDRDSALAPRMVGGGASYSFAEAFTVGGDALVDLSTFDQAEVIFGLGGEYLVAGQFPIRAGYRRDNGRELNQVTASIGYVDQRLGLDIALRQDVGSGPNETELLFGFRYHVQ